MNVKNRATYGLIFDFYRKAGLSGVFVALALAIPSSVVYAWGFSDVVGYFYPASVEQKTSLANKNSQTMALAEAPLNHELNATLEEESSVVVEDSALSASLSISPSNGSDKLKASSDQISVYVVREGDTLSQIAKMFDVSPNTILWANDIPRSSSLRIGQKLVILPVSGIRYTVKKGDTINKIAKKFSADAGDIRDFNDIQDSSLSVGDEIIIPDGMEAPAPVVTPIKKFINSIISPEPSGVDTSGYFIRPAKGPKTQGIHGHNGIDISGRGGLSVIAAAAGEVLISRDSGYNGGYGSYIVINHPNGTQTLYAHLSANFVSAGDHVSQGQLIGNIGNTGRSTGSHLHFEIHGAKNPF